MRRHEGSLMCKTGNCTDFIYSTSVCVQWVFSGKEPGLLWDCTVPGKEWFTHQYKLCKKKTEIYICWIFESLCSLILPDAFFPPSVVNKRRASKIRDKRFDVFMLWLISHMVTEVITLLMLSVSICHGCNSNWLLASDHIIKQRGNNAL